jgi:UDP-N-acetylglucosamine 2-epimerase (non-hydrolysing)
MGVKIAHLESGLRSNDKTMPEEHNRVLTDAITDYFFVTEQSGYDNLIAENKKRENIFFVGNTMIDTLVAFRKEIDAADILTTLGLVSKNFILMTMHRPATVDDVDGLKKLSALINNVSDDLKIVFPIHPRTLKNIDAFNLSDNFKSNKNLILTEPLDYFSFQKLVKEAKLILTDSGGIQEEAPSLGKPVLVMREVTERPEAVEAGTVRLVGADTAKIVHQVSELLKDETAYATMSKAHNPYGDGLAAERIVATLQTLKKPIS